ncbi:hypothetical protein O9G_004968 [Rozella allomycis CSF55]|uniref:Pentacotripeptide-repeat region of PRORP domain-containing protein n=1 Tax=Rozella allomycis (strain CSF55) TaxID=988480 RepID=A0A075AQK3_ROZAC|nr:hypothetical protein O9G_004968 [Rozella allomycis CSF55]|eukprot:EPZ30872.1 hypothetical protein O9G_004968 [Rozella allomycis CSF55]
MMHKSIAIEEDIQTSLIRLNALSFLGQSDEIMKIISSTWSIYVKSLSYDKSKPVSSIIHAMNDIMELQKTRYPHENIDAAISSCIDGMGFKKAGYELEEMWMKLKKSYVLNENAYNSAIEAFCRLKKQGRVIDLLVEMKKNKINLNDKTIYSFSVFLKDAHPNVYKEALDKIKE